jgi:predicted RNA-binding Zn ribbon-like protein
MLVMSSTTETYQFDAGNLGLDFINTLRCGEGHIVDLLRIGSDLERWMASAGMPHLDPPVDLSAPTPTARLLLTEAIRLRDDIEVLVSAFSGRCGLPYPALHSINRTLDASRRQTQVEMIEGHASLETSEVGDSPLAPLVPIALAAATLVAEADPSRVRRCASERCRLWFLDSSKNGRRRWCSMARCGNRAKVARHHRKRSAGT